MGKQLLARSKYFILIDLDLRTVLGLVDSVIIYLTTFFPPFYVFW